MEDEKIYLQKSSSEFGSDVCGGGKQHWINSLKGIGVLLVLFGHVLYGSRHSMVNQLIYSFHMPLFFMLSGFLQRKINMSKLQYLKKKARRLLIPYLYYTLLLLPLVIIACLFRKKGVLEIISQLLYINGRVFFNEPLWFLVVLFEVYVAALVTKLPTQKLWRQIFIIAGVFLFGGMANTYKEIYVFNLFGINRTLSAFGFFGIGLLLYKQYVLYSKRFKNVGCIPILVVSIPIWLTISVNNGKVSMYGIELGNYLMFLLGAISACISIMIIGILAINRECFLSRISKYAILFLGTQYFWIIPFRVVMEKLGLSRTWLYDILVLSCIFCYVAVLPFLYDKLKKRFPLIKNFNGEIK